MTTSNIVNGAPFTNLLGTNDVSTRPPVLEPEVIPAHLAKVYNYAETGPTLPQVVVGDSRTLMYGDRTFDLRQKWATHQTVLSNVIDAEANAQMFQRVIPADAPPPANLRYSIDILVAPVPEFKRHPDGSYMVDDQEKPIPTGATIQGHVAKWVTDFIAPDIEGESTFGKGIKKPGDQIDLPSGNQSLRIPILDKETPHVGSFGNNAGSRMWAPTISSSPSVTQAVIRGTNSYPFRMGCVRRASANVTPRTVVTNAAEQFVDLSLRPAAFDPNTDQELYVGTEFITKYQDLNNANGAPPVWGPFGRVHVYDDNIAALLLQLYEAEIPFIDSTSDFENADGEEYRFNIWGGVSSNDVPYHSFLINKADENAARMSETAAHFASGGGDGTMNESLFAELVKDEVTEYNNPNSYLLDIAKYPESHLYDTGFPLATKMAMCNFIGRRKDTFVVLATHDVLGSTLTASQESALAVALRTRLQMFPESDYFGTPTMRGTIVGRSGKLLNSQYKRRLPLSIELAAKSARYMGAGNGKWKAGFAFDEAPLHQITMFSDINVTFTPMTVRNKDWDNGLVYVENFDRRAVYWPAMKTVYNNDTSVLTSYFTACAIATLQKVGNKTRMTFSGNAKLTNAQLVERVNQDIIDNTLNRFDDRFVIVPETYYTKADQARGYSFTTNIKIYAANMKTVGTISVEAHRIEDLAAA